MANKPEPHRLILTNYPFSWDIDTSYGDMDVAGHVNNVVVTRFYETGRSRWLLKMTGDPDIFKSGFNTVVAEYTVKFLAEVNFPDRATIATGIGRIGNSSFSCQQGLFVDGQCVGLSDASMVLTIDGKPSPIDDALREKMQSFLIKTTQAENT